MQMLKLTEDEEKIAHLRAIADKSPSMQDLVRAYQREGMNPGEAIDKAAQHGPKVYNQWCKAGRPDIQFVGR